MYMGDTIRSFGASLFSVFAPVYLFTLFQNAGFSMPIAWVFVYYAAYWTIAMLTMYQVLKVYPRLGFRNVAFLGAFAICLHAFLLIRAETGGIILLIPAVIAGALNSGMFWPAYHIIFARSAAEGHHAAVLQAEATGTRSAFIRTARLIAPAIGGFIIAQFGFAYVLWAFMILSVVAVFPYSMVEMWDGHRGGIRPLVREFTKPEGKKTGIGFISWGISLPLAAFAWPILLFLLGITYEQLGLLVTAASVVTVIVVYIFGKVSDGHDRHRILRRSSTGYAGAWVLRLLSGGLWSAFVADSIANITGGIAAIPIDSQAYDRLSGEKPNEQVHLIMVREFGINIGKVLGALLVIGLLVSGVPLRWVLGVGIPAALLMPLTLAWSSARKPKMAEA